LSGVADNIYPHSKEGVPQISSGQGQFSVQQVFDKDYHFRVVLYSNRVSQLPYNIECAGFRIQNLSTTGKVYRGSIYSPPYVNQSYTGDNRGQVIYPTTTEPVNLTNTNLCMVTTDTDGTEISVEVLGNTQETLEDNFVSPPQYTSPQVVSTAPTNTATNVNTNTTITVMFDQNIDSATAIDGNVTRSPTFTATVTLDSGDPKKLVIDPTGALSTSTLYTVTLLKAIRDTENDAMAADYVFTFTTAAAPDTTPPTVVSRFPTAGATNVPINVSGTITFSEEMSAASITNTTCRIIRTSDSANQTATVTLSQDKKTATINPNTDLAASTGFTLRATTGVEDIALNNLAAQSDSTFTTAAAPAGDTTPPTITNKSPAAGSTNAAISTNVVITFSEDMLSSSITYGNVGSASVNLRKTSTGVLVPAAISESAGVVTINPNSNLEYGTQYTVHVAGGATPSVKDAAGNAMSDPDQTWTFTTAAQTYTLIYNIAQTGGAWNRLEDTEIAAGLRITSSQSSGGGYPLNGKVCRRVKVRIKRTGTPGGDTIVSVFVNGDPNVSHEIGRMNSDDVDSSSDGFPHVFTNPSTNYVMGVDDTIVVWATNGSDSEYIEVARTTGDDWAFGHRVEYLRDDESAREQEDTDIAMEVYQ
jgi:methionine-rich copper-binding protein CopC